MTSQLIIKIDSEQKEKLSRLAKAEGKTSSHVLREMISKYIKERDISAYIENLWMKIGDIIKNNGYTVENIEGAIRESRNKNK